MSLKEFPSHPFLKLTYPSPFVLQISFNRPPVNAFNKDFWRGLKVVVEIAETHPDVRVIVLTSENPKLYTAGIDIADLGSLSTSDVSSDPARVAKIIERTAVEFQAAITALEKSDKPAIAAIHGLCIGLGVDIISACDIRYCSADSKFSIREAAMGLAADIGTLQRLPKRSGNDSLIRELVYTARYFNAEEAAKLGMVSKIVSGGQKEVIGECLKLATIIAENSPVAVQGSKRILNYSMNHSIEESLHYEAVWNQSMLQSQDLKESVAAFWEKRKPTFAKL